MKDCFQIKTSQELIDYLASHNRDAVDFDYQLDTNAGFIHELKNGEVIFFPNDFQQKAILFESKHCFEGFLQKDFFPIDNPHKELFEIEGERIKTFHLQSDYYRKHLNNVLKFSFEEINKEAAQAYLKKVIGRTIKKLTTETDVVALISIIGELVKTETKGKWFLEKKYGMYNPVYTPNIVSSSANVILISNKVIGLIKWKVSSLESIFNDIHFSLTNPIQWAIYSDQRKNLIMLE